MRTRRKEIREKERREKRLEGMKKSDEGKSEGRRRDKEEGWV